MPQTPLTPAEIAPPDGGVTAKLDEYEKTHAPLALREAADAAAMHDEELPPDPALALRLARQRVSSWLAILELINRDLDDSFDPEDPPNTRVSPPPDASGAQLPPGINPKDVKDPAARQAYIEAIEQTRVRIAMYRQASKLVDAREVIIERAGSSLLDAHTTLGLTLDEMRMLIGMAAIRADDRAALFGVLY